MNSGNRKMIPTKLTREERAKALEWGCELKTAGPGEALCTLTNGSVVAEGLVSEGSMFTEPASNEEATAREPTLMESLIDLSAAIQENERLMTGSGQLCSPKEPASKDPTPNETVPMDLLIDLGPEGVAADDWVKAGPKVVFTTPKEPTPKKHTPMDLLVELSAEERAGTLHSVIRDQDWLKAGSEQPYMLKEPVPEEPAFKESTRKEPVPEERAFKESTRKEPTRKEPTRKEPTRKEPTRKEPTRKEPTRKEPTRKEPTRKEITHKEPTRKEPTRKELTREEPARNEPTFKEPAFKEPAFKEPAFKEPAFKEPAFKEPAFKEPAFKEPAFKETAFKEPAFKEPAFKEPAFKETTSTGTLIDLSNVPRTKVAPLPPMLHGLRHLFGIQRTHEKAVPVFSAIPALVPAKNYDYPSPTSVLAKQPVPKYSSTPPPHMRILSMVEGAATPPHMRTPSEYSSLTRSLSPASSSSRPPSLAPIITQPAKTALDQASRYPFTWEDAVPDYVWVEGAERGEEREW